MSLETIQDALRARRDSPGQRGVARRVRVALGSDHGGYALKQRLHAALVEFGAVVEDLGTHSTAPVDYPDIAAEVARRVASGDCTFGVVIDGVGTGSCMAANKIAGVRAATCHDERSARNSREHNDANVLVFGAASVHPGHARRLLRLWLQTSFAGGRHASRVAKIDALDAERRR